MTSARQDTIPLPGASVPPDAPADTPPRRGDLTPEMLAADWWTDQLVAAAGIPIVDIPFVIDRRRHRLLRHRGLPADLRRPDRRRSAC